MGEHTESGRLPGEIVEIYRAPCSGGERDPREVVEVYRQPDSREVVEVYSRPIPQGRGRKGALTVPPAGKRSKRGLWKFLACVAVLVGLTAAVRLTEGLSVRIKGGYDGGAAPYASSAITIPDWPVGQGASLAVSRDRGEELTAQEVYRQLNPAVVTVQCLTGEGASMGTGVIFTEDGYVITNYHVVRGGSECYVILDSGYMMEVCYVAGDQDSDLAVLKIPPGELIQMGPLPAAPFGDSELLVVGDPVYAIGAPRRLRGTLTNGIISAIDRDVEVEGRTMTLLQTNAALNSGNSGGPLINAWGQVVGINVAKYMSDWNRDSVEGLGFAIPSAQMERIINDLLQWGEVQPEPLLGIMVIGPSDGLADSSQGLLVDSVNPGGAAEKAGVLAGDYILSANGEPTLTNQDLFRVRRRLHLGDELTLTLRRGEETLEVTLLLEEAAE